MALQAQIVIRTTADCKERIQAIADAENRRPSEVGRMLLDNAVAAWEKKAAAAATRKKKAAERRKK